MFVPIPPTGVSGGGGAPQLCFVGGVQVSRWTVAAQEQGGVPEPGSGRWARGSPSGGLGEEPCK